MTSTWKCLLQHTRTQTGLPVWCQKRDSGHLHYKTHHRKPQISGQKEEHADVIAAGGADPALKDHGAGAATPRVPRGRCPQRRRAAWHGVRRGLGGEPACLPSGKWETPTSRGRARRGRCGRLRGGGLARGAPARRGCGVPPLPALPWHLEAGMQATSCAPMSCPPAFPLILGGVFSSGRACRSLLCPGPSCMGSRSRRRGARAALAHDFGGSRGRRACLASREVRWRGVGLLVCGEAGMLMGLLSARERQSKGKKASRRERKKSSAITGWQVEQGKNQQH